MYNILLKNDASVQFYILFNIVEADPQLLFELDLAWLRMSEEKDPLMVTKKISVDRKMQSNSSAR